MISQICLAKFIVKYHVMISLTHFTEKEQIWKHFLNNTYSRIDSEALNNSIS